MSDPKLISPLLDGFAMGAPMSSHNGVVCCPAIKENSDKKYIVKVISVPASQVQMDALLLAGAYRDPADAMDYFLEVAEGAVKEAEVLKTLSKQEGFLSYDAWQIEPITSKRLGYQVYLVGSYKRSLEKYVRRNPVTHLEAINLGLDICEALSACREAGSLYVDLKPTNVFMSEKKEYRIGDLGFISMDALKYTALPDKYHSPYTPPELSDPMASLNLTTDTYALGMMLYQLYNDGQLPIRDPETGEVPSPVNADYELAEILLKAIHLDPAQRWEDPKALQKALTSYMQKNVVNDTPITPYTALEIPEPEVPVQAVPETPVSEEAEEIQEVPAAEPDETEKEPEALPEIPADEDETAPSEADAETLMPHQMSDELSRIIAKADDLISHEAPGGVVVPEIPEAPDPFDFVAKNFDDVDDTDVPFDPVMEEPPERADKGDKKTGPKFTSDAGRKRLKKAFSLIITLVVLAGLAFGGLWYYQNFYLLTVDSITITGDRDQLTVQVNSSIDDSLLTVVCADNYGNVQRGSLTNGQVSFQNLLANTMYQVTLEAEGFHGLVGQTSDIFTTEASTSIVSFSAVTGSEDGSVVLSFTADGEEPEKWTLVYSAEGLEEQRETFTGHTVTITDLAVSKVYTFTLKAENGIPVSGKHTLEYMASRLILAQNLTLTSDGSNDMTVHWEAPGDILVDSWNVRCYNGTGYEEQVIVTETQVRFTGIDPTLSYTVEVTASGMTQPARTSITANPISISTFHMDDTDPSKLTLSWEHTGEDPEGGWLVMYSVDGSKSQNVAKGKTASVEISPRIPGGQYRFTVQAADATSIFGNVLTYACPEAEVFSAHELSGRDIQAFLVKTPEEKNWKYDDLPQEAVTAEFMVGDAISMVLHAAPDFHLPGSQTQILFVIEDGHGNVLPELISQTTGYWKDIWAKGNFHYGELDIPKAPTLPGSYRVRLYLDGALAASADFTVSQ